MKKMIIMLKTHMKAFPINRNAKKGSYKCGKRYWKDFRKYIAKMLWKYVWINHEKDEKNLKDTKCYHICGENFKDKNVPVRDLSHVTNVEDLQITHEI